MATTSWFVSNCPEVLQPLQPLSPGQAPQAGTSGSPVPSSRLPALLSRGCFLLMLLPSVRAAASSPCPARPSLCQAFPTPRAPRSPGPAHTLLEPPGWPVTVGPPAVHARPPHGQWFSPQASAGPHPTSLPVPARSGLRTQKP